MEAILVRWLFFVVVVRGVEEYFRTHPATAELVIEITLSSSEIDVEKAAICAEANVSECWTVLPEEKRVEIFTTPAGRVYAKRRTVEFPQTATAKALPSFQLDLATFFPR